MARFTGAALALGVLVASAACGGSSSSHHPSLTVFAGVPSGAGNLDGLGSAARFNGPQGVAADKFGNVYVADSGNNTIRKVTPAGEVTTLAGMAGQSGCADGTGSAARFNDPRGVAVDGAGNVYVADSGNNSIRKVTPAGEVTTLAGTEYPMGSADGTGADARFDHPQGVAVDGAGNVYVADSGNDSIRKVTPAGEVTTLAGSEYPMGSADGTGAAARFTYPNGVAVDGVGNVYVADTGSNTIRKVTPAGVVTTLAGKAWQVGNADGTGAAARFNDPRGVAVDRAGNVYVADRGNNSIRKVTPAGVVTTIAGSPLLWGTIAGPLPSSLSSPFGVAVDPTTGNLFVVLPDAVVEVWL